MNRHPGNYKLGISEAAANACGRYDGFGQELETIHRLNIYLVRIDLYY